MDFHIGTDTAQYSIPDNGTKVYMTFPVYEQPSIPVWHTAGVKKYMLSKLIWVEL